MLVEPRELAIGEIDLVVRLTDAVRLARVTNEDRFDAAPTKGPIIKLALLNRPPGVLFAVRDHDRRLDAIHISHRRPLRVSLTRRPRQAAETVSHQVGDVCLAEEAVPIADAGVPDATLEAVGLRDRPEGNEAAVSTAEHAKPIRVGDA